MFEAILNTQGQALESLMDSQPTANPKLMQEAKERLEEAICMAIQAAKETTDGDIQAQAD
ncbi:hypothetical protein NM449_17555 (plasmid) [Vibrio metschnikovii]|uniref:hypothetical protein n=1 Tax=Vibrio metschnikovii TaxID=28172 RepID=UPI002A5DD8CD|nr:hypothetical protein [Vibrio metschnikovii]